MMRRNYRESTPTSTGKRIFSAQFLAISKILVAEKADDFDPFPLRFRSRASV
jgi:hypothetical protein